MARRTNRPRGGGGSLRARAVARLRTSIILRLLGSAALCASFAVGAAGQSAPLPGKKIPTGLRPMGMEACNGDQILSSNAAGIALLVIANSGENSVSVLSIGRDLSLDSSKTISGIPSPFGVSRCPLAGSYGFAVTSPSDNSISFIDAYKGTVIARTKVGSQPYSAICWGESAFVSNYGDNTVSVVDGKSFTVTRTIPNIPGNRGLRGVTATADGTTNAWLWVAGTDTNVLTVANATTGAIVASIPVRAPTFLTYLSFNETAGVGVASALDNAVYGLDSRTLAVTGKFTGVPTPLDSNGWLATTGSGNSVVDFSVQPATIYVSGIPGAAGITSFHFSSRQESHIFVTSPDSNSVFIDRAPPAAPVPNEFSIVGATFGSVGAALGGLASAFGGTGTVQGFTAQSLPLAKTLGGVSLRIGGALTYDAANNRWNYSSTSAIDAPLLYVGPNQVNFQMPPGVSPGSSVPAQLTKPDGTTLLTKLNIAAAAPGIFTVLQNGAGQGAVLNQDNTLNFGTNPAKRGSVIQIFATGAGETTPALAAGEAASASGNPLVLTKVQPTVTIGGKNATVQFSGMAPGFVGLWQINAEVPPEVTPGFAVPLVITAAGAQSNAVTIAVQ